MSSGYTEGLLPEFPTVALALCSVGVILQYSYSTSTFLRRFGEGVVLCLQGGWRVSLNSSQAWQKQQVCNFFWEFTPWLGSKGVDVNVGLGREGKVRQNSLENIGQDPFWSIACKSYATSGSDISVLQNVFTCRSTCLSMLHMKKLQAACSLTRKGRLWADCPNTFNKDLLIKTLQWGSIFRCTS